MFHAGGFLSVTNYISGPRKFRHDINNGRVVVSDTKENGDALKYVVTVKDGAIATQSERVNGHLTYFVEYGRIEKTPNKTLRFRRGTNRALDGLSTRRNCWLTDDLDGNQIIGTCKTYYRRGRVIWQKFYHHGTRCMAYHFRPMAKRQVVKRIDGTIFAEINGRIETSRWENGIPVFCSRHPSFSRIFHLSLSKPTTNPFIGGTGSCTIFGRNGKVLIQYGFEDRQRTGEWIDRGNRQYYINGLEVSKDLYETPIENFDPAWVMKIKDVDTRSIFINRIGMGRIMDAFDAETIHEEQDMALLRMKFPDDTRHPFNILKVICTTTRQPYYLRVPTNIPECEQARQWTFGIDPGEKQIQFDIET